MEAARLVFCTLFTSFYCLLFVARSLWALRAIMIVTSVEHAGSKSPPSTGLPYCDQEWQDASAAVTDFALQAAVADGVVSFVHSAAGMQEKLKHSRMACMDDNKAGSLQHEGSAGSKENENPADADDNMCIDDVTCLELD